MVQRVPAAFVNTDEWIRQAANVINGLASIADNMVVNVKDRGAVGNNAADDTNAIQRALNSIPFGGTAYFPPGVYRYTSLTVPSGVSILGAGRYSTVLMATTSTGAILCNSSGGDNEIARVKLTSAVTRTVGYEFVSVQSNNVTISDVAFESYSLAVRVGTPGTLLAVNFTLENAAFRSPQTGSGTGGIQLDNYANAVLNNIGAAGPTLPAQQPDCFIRQRNGDTCLMININITLHGVAWLVNTPVGENVYATQVVNCLFDSAGTISGGVSAQSASIVPAGNIQETLVSNCWFGLSQGSHGLYLEGQSGTGTVDGFSVTNSQFVANSGSGFIANGTRVRNWSVTDSKASGNAIGIRAAGATTRFKIMNNHCGNIGGRGINTTGIQVDSATAADWYTITGNTVFDNSTPLFDGGTGTNKIVSNNL